MQSPVRLLVNEKLRLQEILRVPMNVLEQFGCPEGVSWISFENKKTELEGQLADIFEALSKIDPDNKFHT